MKIIHKVKDIEKLCREFVKEFMEEKGFHNFSIDEIPTEKLTETILRH